MPILTREMKQVLSEQRLGFVATVGHLGLIYLDAVTLLAGTVLAYHALQRSGGA